MVIMDYLELELTSESTILGNEHDRGMRKCSIIRCPSVRLSVTLAYCFQTGAQIMGLGVLTP